MQWAQWNEMSQRLRLRKGFAGSPWAPGAWGRERRWPPLHLCYCCHPRCLLEVPGSPGRSPVGHGPGTPQWHLELGCVGLSPQLLLFLAAEAGLLLENWQVRSMSVCLAIQERWRAHPLQPCPPPL